MRNIAKKFKMTMSLIDIETIKPRYKCFFGEDVELCIKVIDEDTRPVDLTDVNAKVYYTCDNFEPLRQDNGITINEPFRNGTINILVNKKYLRLGVNTIRVALFDSDQVVLLQPCQVNCIETGIGDEHGGIIVSDDINVKDEFVRTNNRISGVDGRLKVVEGDIPEMKSELVEVNEQLAEIPNQNYITDKATNVRVDNLERQIGQGVTDVQLENAVQSKVDDGTIGSIQIGEDMVRELNTTFIKPTKNLFNKNTISQNTILYGETGITAPLNGWNVSDYINIIGVTRLNKNSGFAYAFYNANKVFISGKETPSGYWCDVPSNAKYFRFAVNNDELNTATVYSSDRQPTSSTEVVYTPYELKIKSELLPLVKEKWENTVWLSIGDSLTYQQQWQWKVMEDVKFKQNIIEATPGWQLADFMGKVTSTQIQSADFITIILGMNDFGGAKPLGTIADKTNDTFYGAMYKSIEKILTVKPYVRVLFIIPPEPGKHQNYFPNRYDPNSIGKTYSDYVKAIIDFCNRYSIPYIDLSLESGFNEFNQDYFYTNEDDYVHFNVYGGEVVGRCVASKIKTL